MMRSVCCTLLFAALSATPSASWARSQAMRAAPSPNVIPGTVCNTQPLLAYSNGPLIQHVKVVTVFYSPNNKYKTMLEQFYTSITQSAHFDWLTEYNKGSYKIGRGSWLSSFEDANPAPAAGATVKTIDPEMYLKGLLAANKLPKPDDDTIYMMYFPDGIDPTDGQGSSCVKPMGDFCAYHASYTDANKQLVRYGVMPDLDAMGCMTGCGPTGFPGLTDVSSHELIEAVTDPDNGTGWYDNPTATDPNASCGEIGDICAVGGTMETAVVNGFTVQKEWSNKNSKCIGTDPTVMVNDFTVDASPTTVQVPAGGMATVNLTLAKTTGVSDTVALSASTVANLTASFAPASVMSAAGTSTLTISADPSLAPGMTLTLTVTAKGTVVSHTTPIMVQIVAAPDMATPPSTGGGGNGNHGGGGCAMAPAGVVGGAWSLVALVIVALAFRRRRAA